MKYSEKINSLEVLYKRIIEGASFEQVAGDTRLIDEFKISKYELEKLVDQTIRDIYNNYMAEIKSCILDNKSLKTLNELSALHDDFIPALHTKGINDLNHEARKEVEKLLDENYSEEEILEKIRLDIYPKDKVMDQVLKWNADKDAKQNKNNWHLYGGALLLSISLLTMLSSSGQRPLYIIGIAGLVLLWKGLNNSHKLKKL
ncbi:MAG: hypothetical protein KA479_04755 [Saprospiraceae bacterium]|nr:hypothetical protein [Saprospiraceae bacterium]